MRARCRLALLLLFDDWGFRLLWRFNVCRLLSVRCFPGFLRYDGDIPRSVEEMSSVLPGVGPKMSHLCVQVLDRKRTRTQKQRCARFASRRFVCVRSLSWLFSLHQRHARIPNSFFFSSVCLFFVLNSSPCARVMRDSLKLKQMNPKPHPLSTRGAFAKGSASTCTCTVSQTSGAGTKPNRPSRRAWRLKRGSRETSGKPSTRFSSDSGKRLLAF